MIAYQVWKKKNYYGITSCKIKIELKRFGK